LVPAEAVYELHKYKEHFGLENFINIFKTFYYLCDIPHDAENNIFALSINQNSINRGFDTVFGIDIEEVSIRFFNLFVEPQGKPKMTNIDILRFFYVVMQLCNLNSDDLSHV
jgi:hypothetical protein